MASRTLFLSHAPARPALAALPNMCTVSRGLVVPGELVSGFPSTVPSLLPPLLSYCSKGFQALTYVLHKASFALEPPQLNRISSIFW